MENLVILLWAFNHFNLNVIINYINIYYNSIDIYIYNYKYLSDSNINI